jgi:hypothetical protein
LERQSYFDTKNDLLTFLCSWQMREGKKKYVR